MARARAGIGTYREKLRPSGRASIVMWWSHTRASVLQAQLAELLPPADSDVWQWRPRTVPAALRQPTWITGLGALVDELLAA